MFRVALIGLSALALGLTTLPVLAQPTPAPQSRDHRTAKPPPAPTPTVNRDQRKDSTTGGITPGEPRQWMIRDISAISPNVEYTIINLRRQYLDLSSKMTFQQEPSGFADGTGWGDGGGMWIFKREDRPDAPKSGPIKEGEYVALYNTKTKRYLRIGQDYFPLWGSKPLYVWIVQHVKTGKDGSLRFAFSSVEQRRYLGLCDKSLDPFGDREELCVHVEPRGWRP